MVDDIEPCKNRPRSRRMHQQADSFSVTILVPRAADGTRTCGTLRASVLFKAAGMQAFQKVFLNALITISEESELKGWDTRLLHKIALRHRMTIECGQSFRTRDTICTRKEVTFIQCRRKRVPLANVLLRVEAKRSSCATRIVRANHRAWHAGRGSEHFLAQPKTWTERHRREPQ